jgi:hypothetical protein
MNYAAILVALLALMSAASACVDCSNVDFSFSTSSSQLGSFSVSESVNANDGVQFGGDFTSSPFTGVSFESQASGSGKGLCYQETTSASYLKTFNGVDPWSYQTIKLSTDDAKDQFQIENNMQIGSAFSGIFSSGLVSVDKFALTEHYDNFEGYVWDASVNGFDMGHDHNAIQFEVVNGFRPISQVTENKINVIFGTLP